MCVRIVFCLYAEDAAVFGKKGLFHDYMAQFDAKGARKGLRDLFRVLDQTTEERDPYLADDDPLLAAFPYVNGGLFKDEDIEIPPFTDEILELILHNASIDFDWSGISPTIFGAVFESTLNPETRRKGGMHYTSIENIHKVIDPLFLDGLKSELAEIKAVTVLKTREKKLRALQDKLASLVAQRNCIVAFNNLFKDVSERDWFFDDVSYACRSRWMNGVAEDRFDLKMPLNRAAFVTVLYRFDLMPESPESSFTDVPDNTWHTEAVGCASDAGIVNGVGHNQYAPLDDITREQMAAILYRYMNYRGLDVSAKDDADLSGFIDADEIYDCAADAVRWAVGCGLLQGRGNGVLAPRGTATRAEVATVFHRLEAVVKAAEALAADPA